MQGTIALRGLTFNRACDRINIMEKHSTDALIAAYLAKGGRVTKAALGEGLGISDRKWHMAARDDFRGWDKAKPADTSAHEQRAEMLREAAHTGGTAAVNDLLGQGY